MFFKKNYEAEQLYKKAVDCQENKELYVKYLKEAASLGYVPAQLSLGNFDDMILSKVDFSVRSQNVFRSNNIVYLSDLIRFTERDFLRMPNLGRKSLDEIKSFLEFKGLNFGFKLPETNSEQNNSDTSDILYLNFDHMLYQFRSSKIENHHHL